MQNGFADTKWHQLAPNQPVFFRLLDCKVGAGEGRSQTNFPPEPTAPQLW
jgi:hypothetical protein